MSLTKVEFMDQNYKILRTLDSTQINDLTYASFPSTAVRRMRVYFSGLQVTAGYNYTAMIGMEARNSLILPETISGVFPYVSGVYQSDCSYTFYRKGSTSGTIAGTTYFDTYYEVYSNFNAQTSGYILFLEFDLGSTWNIRGFGVPTNYLVANPQSSGGGSSGGGSSGSDSNLGSEIQNSTNVIIDNNNKNTNKVTEEIKKQTEEQKKTNDLISDDSDVDTSKIDSLVGYLPAGPVDSIINLPLSMLNSINTNLSKDCSTLQISIPFINEKFTLPCVSSLYDKMGATTLINSLGAILAAILLYKYLLNLYKYVDHVLSLQGDRLNSWGD